MNQGSRNPIAPLRKFRELLLSRPFQPHRVIPHPHLQTMASALARRDFGWGALNTETLALELPGQTRVRSECYFGNPGAPTLLAIHGMGGSSQSPYMQGFLHKACREGWNAVLLNLYDLNLAGSRPVIFHSGSSRELEGIVHRVLDLDQCGTLVLVAVSMGGNILLKLLGEWGDGAPHRVRAAAVVSPLVDLMASWDTLDRLTNRPYRWHYVQGLKQVVRKNERHLAKHIDVEGIRKIKSIREFDEIFTSVLGGFQDAFDYYRRASASPWLERIRVPTLVLHSKRDPILPWGPLMTPGLRENPSVLLWLSREGGHVGFIEQERKDIDRHWAENRIIDFARLRFGPKQDSRARQPGLPNGTNR